MPTNKYIACLKIIIKVIVKKHVIINFHHLLIRKRLKIVKITKIISAVSTLHVYSTYVLSE